MDWNLLSLLVLLVLPMNTVHCSQNCVTSSSGTHFMIGFPDSGDLPDYISLQITSRNSTNVRIIAPSISFDTSFKCNQHLVVKLSNAVMLKSSEVIRKNGIKIISDDPCTVTVLSHHLNDAVEGFMALPVNALGTSYIVSSYTPSRIGRSELVIAAPENETVVVMEMNNNNKVSKLNITLNEFDTYMYQASFDMSGSLIRSDKPVAVFSGCSACNIPDGIGDYQYIVEQMIPTEFLAKTFIIPPIYPRNDYMFRVYPLVDNTTLLLYRGLTNQKDILRSTSSYEYIEHNPSVLISDQPISVIQYGYDNDNLNGDPFMTTAQAISQYQSSYEFISNFDAFYPSKSDVTLVVTALTSDLSDIWLDSNSVQNYQHVTEIVRPPFTNYSIIYINITCTNMDEYHTLLHKNGQPFGATLYSQPYQAGAYGYPLQLVLKKEVCQISTPTTSSTTTTTTTSSTTTTTTMTSSTATTTPPTTTTTAAATATTRHTTTPIKTLPLTSITVAGSAAITTTIATTKAHSTTILSMMTKIASHSNKTGIMRCFRCGDIPHLKYCDNVDTCSENEVCYLESYTTAIGKKLFKSGCVKPEVCNMPTGPNECRHCCESFNFCNNEGCGDSGVAGLNRGPYCYDCTHVGEGENCQSVQMCPSDQVCMVQKFVWGDNDYNYVMGCTQPHVCEVKKRSQDYNPDRKLTTRHVPECTRCCSSDFCNDNCTRHNIQEIVG